MNKRSFRKRPIEPAPTYPSLGGTSAERRKALAAVGAAFALASCVSASPETSQQVAANADAAGVADAGIDKPRPRKFGGLAPREWLLDSPPRDTGCDKVEPVKPDGRGK